MATEAIPLNYGWRLEDLDDEEMILQMGPQHPATHGVLRVELKTDGEIVKDARVHIGYLHRCFEKHAEKIGVGPFQFTPPNVHAKDA